MRSSDDNLSPRSPREGRRSGDRVLVAAVRGAGRWLAPLMLLATLGAAATLALPALLGRAIDQIVTAARAGDPTWSAAGGTLLATAGLVLLVVAVDVASNLVAGGGTAETTGKLRRRLVSHILAAGPDLSRRTSEGDLVARLVSGTATSARAVVVVAGLAAAVIPPAGAVVALGLIDPWLALTFLVGMVSVSGAVRTYLQGSHAATAGYLEAQGSIATRMVDALAGTRTIAAARTTEREIGRVLSPMASLREQGAAVWENLARLAFRGEPVVLLTQVAVIAVAGARMSSSQLTAGELLAASRYAVMAAGIGGMLDELAALTRARAAAQRVAEVLDAPAPTYGGRDLPAGPGTLQLHGITAGPADPPVLDGLDLVVPGGAVCALVGRSGAGKSLVAALAGRLCDPDGGEVLLDGVPLPELDRPALRRAVAYAFERPALLNGTVAETIRFGADTPSLDRIRDAARAARADTFIARLPDGYASSLADTPLSGGELQRIGLARALAHEARVLILDDATSSLDTATEAQIAGAITTQMQGRTRLIVTHRRATAARADLVAWLDGGRIRACAPHRDLWAEPDYRAIFRPDTPADPPPDLAAWELPIDMPTGSAATGGPDLATPDVDAGDDSRTPVPAAARSGAARGPSAETVPWRSSSVDPLADTPPAGTDALDDLTYVPSATARAYFIAPTASVPEPAPTWAPVGDDERVEPSSACGGSGPDAEPALLTSSGPPPRSAP